MSRKLTRFVIHNSDTHRAMVAVHVDTHAAIKAFAAVRNTTLIDALEYLVIKGLAAEYADNSTSESSNDQT